MKKHIGIDIGTSNTVIYLKGKGIVLREPSVVAMDNKRVEAVGLEAKRMLGKTPGSMKTIFPLKNGVIAEFDATGSMLKKFIGKAVGSTLLSRPKALVCIPYGTTEVERRAFQEVTFAAGAQSLSLVEEPLAAAIGAGIRIEDAHGSMIVNIGGGKTEVAIISYGSIVYSTSILSGGNELDSAISAYIKKKYNVLVGDVTAESLKKDIGSAHPSFDKGVMQVRGRNLQNGLPAVLNVSSAEIREAMSGVIAMILKSIKNALENAPPELAADIYNKGIVLAGGGALIPGISQTVAEFTGIKTFVAKNPMDCVAMGLGRIIDSGNDSVTFQPE